VILFHDPESIQTFFLVHSAGTHMAHSHGMFKISTKLLLLSVFKFSVMLNFFLKRFVELHLKNQLN